VGSVNIKKAVAGSIQAVQGGGAPGLMANTIRAVMDVQQRAHIEMTFEPERGEPRLSRLLGHVKIYERASCWLNSGKSLFYLASLGQNEKSLVTLSDPDGRAASASQFRPKN
jgi:hypothetical protein